MGKATKEKQETPKEYKMKKIITLCLLTCACLHDPYEAPRNFAKDDLWCYNKSADNGWRIRGLAYTCPEETAYGSPTIRK